MRTSVPGSSMAGLPPQPSPFAPSKSNTPPATPSVENLLRDDAIELRLRRAPVGAKEPASYQRRGPKTMDAHTSSRSGAPRLGRAWNGVRERERRGRVEFEAEVDFEMVHEARSAFVTGRSGFFVRTRAVPAG